MFAGMAELVDALDLGSSERSWGFESLYPHQKNLACWRFFLLRIVTHWALPSKRECVWNPHGVAGARRSWSVSGVKFSLDCESLYLLKKCLKMGTFMFLSSKLFSFQIIIYYTKLIILCYNTNIVAKMLKIILHLRNLKIKRRIL